MLCLNTLSQRIADFVLSMHLEDVPVEVIRHGKLLLADTFGVALSCQQLPHADAIRKTLLTADSAKQATLWGTGRKVSVADAVLYNAALIHGNDFDDTHVAGIVHPSAAVVSTAITVGEAIGADGHQMMEAIICGWEVIIRLALAAKGRFHDRGFHGTGLVAPFASACVAAKLMGDTKETLVSALGLCGSQAAAIQTFLQDGSWVKKIHPGWGCHSAIYALNMARNGFIGSIEVFEGKFGMWMTHFGSIDGLEESFSDLGVKWHTPEVTVKLYPVCHMTHSFIDCMLRAILENRFEADEIDYIECRIDSLCYPIVCAPREVKVRPESDYMMRFSLPYVVAVAAITHGMGSAQIDLKFAHDPSVQDLMDRVTCIDDNSKSNPGHFPAYITIELKDGRRIIMDQRYEMGTVQNPLNLDAVSRKLQNNLETLYSPMQIDTLLDRIDKFESLPNANTLIKAFLAKSI